MKYNEGFGSKLFDWLLYIGMMLFMLTIIYPFLNIVAVSLSSPTAVTSGVVTWWPIGLNVEAYKEVINSGLLFIGYRNTILYALLGTILTLTLTSLAAYSLSIRTFMLRKFMTVYWAITMFFSGGLIPTYLVVNGLGMRNTIWAMVIPGCVGAYTIFVFRTSFGQIPSELRESAYIDGANDLLIWWTITIPLSKALIATFALFTIVGHWNSWFNALLYLRDFNLMPLQIFLRRVTISADLSKIVDPAALHAKRVTARNIQMASVLLALFPMLCVYPFIQRYFVKGVMIGAIKG